MAPKPPTITAVTNCLEAGLQRPLVWKEAKGHGDADWSQAILTSLAALGIEHGHTPRHRPKYGGTGELLLDMTWLQPDDQGRLQHVPFACECELDFSPSRPKKRTQDFDKLLPIRSPFRVFICQESNAKKGNNPKHAHAGILDKLIVRLEAFKEASEEDEFLLIVLNYRSLERYMTYRAGSFSGGLWSFTSATTVTF